VSWNSLNVEEHPFPGQYVRAMDGRTVFPATFLWEYPDNEEEWSHPFKGDEWRDESGKLLAGITYCMFHEDSPDRQPGPPAECKK
jgi:hypothetical protein